MLNQRSPDPEELADSVFPFMAISGLAAVCPYLEDDRLAVQIAETLRPYRSYWAHAYSNVAGPVAFFLAICAAATGDHDNSIALYEASEQVLVDFGCYGLLPLCRLSYANVLQRRGLPNDHMRAMHLLDQVRQGATTIQAPNLVAMAERLTGRSTLETKRQLGAL